MRLRSVAALLSAALLLGACAGAGVRAGSGDDPERVTSTIVDPEEPGPTPSPRLVEPRDGLVDVIPHDWNGFEVVDEDTVILDFYGGVEECYGVDRVDVVYAEDSITLSLFSGRVPEAEVCIEIAEWQAIRVDLEQPIDGRAIVDGAGDPGPFPSSTIAD